MIDYFLHGFFFTLGTAACVLIMGCLWALLLAALAR